LQRFYCCFHAVSICKHVFPGAACLTNVHWNSGSKHHSSLTQASESEIPGCATIEDSMQHFYCCFQISSLFHAQSRECGCSPFSL
jgi:hypothetical protein